MPPFFAVATMASRLRPWIGVVSFALAPLIGHLVGPGIAIVIFVWMIVYQAATSEGVNANRVARLFAPTTARQG